MEIVIKIPDRIYKIIQNRVLNIMDDEILENALRNGKPLPVHHGRLIDISEYEKYFNTAIIYDDGNHEHVVYTDTIPTIIEANKGVLEKINEKQDSLKATCKAWDEAIEKNGSVN